MKVIILKEIKEKLTDGKIFIFFMLCIFLLPLSSVLMHNDYKRRMTVYEEVVKEDNNKQYIKPIPFSIVASGASRIGEAPKESSPISKLFGNFDLAYIVEIFISLFAMIVGASLISEENNSGTLRLILSNSIGKSKLILAKITGGLVLIVLPLLISFILYIILFITYKVETIDMTVILRFIYLFIISVLYAIIFLNLGLLVSILCKNYVTVYFISLFIWSILLFFLPSFSLLTVQLFNNVSPAELIYQRKYEKFVEIIPAGGSFEELNNAWETINSKYYNEIENQVGSSEKLIFLPSISIKFATTSVCGTGIRNWKEWHNFYRKNKENKVYLPKSKINFQNEIIGLLFWIMITLMVILWSFNNYNFSK